MSPRGTRSTDDSHKRSEEVEHNVRCEHWRSMLRRVALSAFRTTCLPQQPTTRASCAGLFVRFSDSRTNAVERSSTMFVASTDGPCCAGSLCPVRTLCLLQRPTTRASAVERSSTVFVASTGARPESLVPCRSPRCRARCRRPGRSAELGCDGLACVPPGPWTLPREQAADGGAAHGRHC